MMIQLVSQRRTALLCIAAYIGVVSGDSVGRAAEFILLPQGATASAVSANGLWITGSQDGVGTPSPPLPPFFSTPFRWSRSTGFQLIEPRTFLYGQAISNDGAVIAGASRLALSPPPEHTGPFVWMQDSGLIDLGNLEGMPDQGQSFDLSADGSVVVGGVGEPLIGGGLGGTPQAFRWTASSGMVGLGDLNGGAMRSFATAVSPDGAVVVGEGTYFADVGAEAFRWTAETGMVGLGHLPGYQNSSARDVSSDGSTVIGISWQSGDARAFRWFEGTGMVDLDFTVARAVTGDGQTVVGEGDDGFGETEAVIWDPTNGRRRLKDVLVADFGLGQALAGWDLISARDISADGRTIIGTAEAHGNVASFVFTAVPEPSAVSIGATAAWFLLCGRRTMRRGASTFQSTLWAD